MDTIPTKCNQCHSDITFPEACHYLVWDLCSDCGFKAMNEDRIEDRRYE